MGILMGRISKDTKLISEKQQQAKYVWHGLLQISIDDGDLGDEVDQATWENGNLVKVYDDAYGVEHENVNWIFASQTKRSEKCQY